MACFMSYSNSAREASSTVVAEVVGLEELVIKTERVHCSVSSTNSESARTADAASDN
jgi:hypothetical protein